MHEHLATLSSDNGSSTPPPSYKVMEMIAPPHYNDALQDALVSQQVAIEAEKVGEQEEKKEEKEEDMVEVPLVDDEVRSVQFLCTL